jgi:hypothetical protein
MSVHVTPALAERLRAMVLAHCGGQVRVFTCEFRPGGRTHGVGVASDLWCVNCGHSRMWHDVAIAAALVVEREARPPLLREVS